MCRRRGMLVLKLHNAIHVLIDRPHPPIRRMNRKKKVRRTTRKRMKKKRRRRRQSLLQRNSPR